MSKKYSEQDLHKFIRSFVKSEGGELVDTSEEYFEIKFPHSLSSVRYTYQPAIAREKEIDLIATGSPAFEGIVQECLNKGTLSAISIRPKQELQTYLEGLFKDSSHSCDNCEKIRIEDEDLSFCTKSPRCYHRIRGGKIVSTRVVEKRPIKLLQFYFSAIFKNKLRKNEETIKMLVDEDGNIYDCDILANEKLEFLDSPGKIELDLFDDLKLIVDEELDSTLKDKQAIFNLILEKQVTSRLRNLERKMDEEKLEKSISKKNVSFNENEWKKNRDFALQREKESLETLIDVKFLNLLLVNTQKVFFEILLENNSKVRSSFIEGADSPTKVVCPGCGKQVQEGYATEDGLYLCLDCIKQSVETGKIYSKNYELAVDSTTDGHIEKDQGFKCSVCGQLNCTHFEFKCSHDGSSVCISCCALCDKCERLFSVANVTKSMSGKVFCVEHIAKCDNCASYIGIDESKISYDGFTLCTNCRATCANCGRLFSKADVTRSKQSGKTYCAEHIINCENCASPVGIDEYKICYALGKKVCSCTSFQKCSLCEQHYSTESLMEGRCPACNNLSETKESELITPVILHDSSRNKTRKWLVGKNKMNSVIIAKGLFLSTLFVVQGGRVTFQKSVPFLTKLGGR